MTQRLIRVFLAIAVAFVFAGRMEAATQHCARLAHEAEPMAPAPTADLACHSIAEAASAAVSQHVLHGDMHKTKAPDRCECIAVLNCYTSVGEAVASSLIEPYEWMQPETVTFASNEPSPDWRPPRA